MLHWPCQRLSYGAIASLISWILVGSTPTSDTWPQGHALPTDGFPSDRAYPRSFFARPANDTANILTIDNWIAIVITEPHPLQRQIKT
jgi:hypothetical protein